MIPKVIHYCWFGGNSKPKLAQKCIASWRSYCPDYRIIEWNENNFDLNSNAFTKEAYEQKKWAFITDYVRLFVLYNYGGVYMDTDVEVIRPIDVFLSNKGFTGFESDNFMVTGIMASEKQSHLMFELLSYYNDKHFVNNDGTLNTKTNTSIITEMLEKIGFVKNNERQTINGFTLYPKEYFCPKNYITGEVNITPNTYSIHHFEGSWIPEENKLRDKYFAKFKKFLPKRIAIRLAIFLAVKKIKGFRAAIKTPLIKLNKK